MNSVLRLLISLGILTCGAFGFWMLSPPDQETRPPETALPPRVEIAEAIEHKDGIQFELDGVVVPFRQIDIAAQVSGKINFKAEHCKIGRAVKKGELLIRIEQVDYDIEVRRIDEELKQASAMVDELVAEIASTDNQITSARENLEIEARQLERSSDLFDRRVTSDSEVDDARRAELNSRNALQTLIDQKNVLTRRRVRLESAKSLSLANLEKAKLALLRTEIRAPIDGVIIAENAEKDAFVQPGTVLLGIQDTSQLDVTCKLHMRQMHWLWQGQETPLQGDVSEAYAFPETPAKVRYTMGNTEFEWQGVVNRFDGAGIDSQTRMVPCLVYVPNPLDVKTNYFGGAKDTSAQPPSLMTGMFVEIEIDARPPIALVRLPQEAVQPGNTVWIVKDRKLKRREISIATSNSDYVVAYQEIGGLQAGDSVVISPLATPVEDASVSLPGDEPPAGRRSGAPGNKRG